jgi:large subunit ribosomal protein L16
MLFVPKKSKYKKMQKGSICKGYNSLYDLKTKTNKLIKIVSSELGSLHSKELTAFRFLIKKYLKKKIILTFVVFPQKSMTKKPAEIRMGKGKGSVNLWSTPIKKGSIICVLLYKKVDYLLILKVLRRAQIRLSINTKIKFYDN